MRDMVIRQTSGVGNVDAQCGGDLPMHQRREGSGYVTNEASRRSNGKGVPDCLRCQPERSLPNALTLAWEILCSQPPKRRPMA